MQASEISGVLKQQHLPALPKLMTLIAQHETKSAEILEARYQPDKQRDELATVTADTLRPADALLSTLLTADTEMAGGDPELVKLKRERNQEVGRLRGNRDPGPRRLQLSLDANTVVTTMGDLDAAEASIKYDDAVLGGDGATIRSVGAAALRRIRSLAAAQPEHKGATQLDTQRRDLERRFTEWSAANRSPGDTVRAADVAIADRERRLRDAFRHGLKFAGLRT